MDGDAPIGRSGAYAKGVARRQEILDRAIEVFAERGAAGTSLRQIAQAIGVSHAALLHYFDSREQLLVAVYDHAESGRDRGGQTASGAVDLMVEAAVHNVAVPGMVQLYSTLVAAALEDGAGESRPFFTDRFERVRGDSARRIREEQKRGTVRNDIDAESLASMLIAISDGLQTQWLLDPSIDLEGTLAKFQDLIAPR
nr:TetR/AcrR family transcriptional regulator [Microbacterium indicum]